MIAKPPIATAKPGWMARLFGIEAARLIACDARWTGDSWERQAPFQFVYRSTRGKFFELSTPETWKILTEAEARARFASLTEKLASEEDAFEPLQIPPAPRSSDEIEDTRRYHVVRNDGWEFSVWLDHKPLPRGWHTIGVGGSLSECLEFIEQTCVFGAPISP